VACERTPRRSGAVALAAEVWGWLANIGGTIGSRATTVKSIRTVLVRIEALKKGA